MAVVFTFSLPSITCISAATYWTLGAVSLPLMATLLNRLLTFEVIQILTLQY